MGEEGRHIIYEQFLFEQWLSYLETVRSQLEGKYNGIVTGYCIFFTIYIVSCRCSLACTFSDLSRTSHCFKLWRMNYTLCIQLAR